MTEKFALAWPVHRRRLERADSYWLGTTRPDGRPHAAPVWGVWLDGWLYFATDPDSIKGRNLRGNPHAVLHLDDSLDVLIVEGDVSLVDDSDTLQRVDEAMSRKYVVPPTGETYKLAVDPTYRVWAFPPRRAISWWDPAGDLTRRRWRWTTGTDPEPA